MIPELNNLALSYAITNSLILALLHNFACPSTSKCMVIQSIVDCIFEGAAQTLPPFNQRLIIHSYIFRSGV